MATTVLVPDERGAEVLGGIDGVTAVVYDLSAVADGALPDGAEEAAAMVVTGSDVQAELDLMGRLPRLQLVQTMSAGYERWQGRLPAGAALSNARGAHGGATAEWAVAALLAVLRELPRFAANMADGTWDQHETESLDGRHVVVLGAGDLAENFRSRATPFGAEVTLVARSARDGVRSSDDLPELLPTADAVVVLLPMNEATRGYVDAAFLARLPDHAVVVNAGRGPLVDTGALLAELQSGRLRAALDVTDPEPLPPDHPLWSAPGVLVTPHVGGSTTGHQDRAWRVAAEQIRQFVTGGRPENLVG